MADREGSRYLSVLIRAAQKAHLHGRSWPRGDVSIPLHPKKVQSEWDASSSETSRQWGVAVTGAGFFLPPGQTSEGSRWQILRLLKSSSRDRTSSWAACLNQNHKLLGSV